MNCETENKDLLLAQRVASGDVDAQEELYFTFKAFVTSACMKVVRNADIAEDLSQLTFMQIFQKIKTFAGAARLSTWIYRIAVNQALMYLRREKRHHRCDSLTDLEDFRPPIFRDHIEDRMLLENCINELPPSYKSFFVLHDVFGFEHTECADLLGKSEGTSKSQLHKARQKMRRLIKRKQNPKTLAEA